MKFSITLYVDYDTNQKLKLRNQSQCHWEEEV